MLPIDIYDFFLNKIKEKYVLDKIIIFKNRMELYQKKDDLIKKYKDKDNIWFYITINEDLSIDFMREFKEDINWRAIINFKLEKLNEDIIKEFIDKLNIRIILRDFKVSEKFMLEFLHKLDWYFVLKYQNPSEEFIEKYCPKKYKN